ncbi:hypothetical protein V8C86DRAFT_3143047 [Haematococcus lacustris]
MSQRDKTLHAVQALRKRVDGQGLNTEKIRQINKEIGLPLCPLAVTRLELNCQLLTEIPDCIQDFQDCSSLLLGHNRINHIAHLSRLTQLRCLYLNNNAISNIQGLQGLLQLRVLDLSSNQIQRLEGLQGLPALEALLLGANQLSSASDIKHLLEVPSLVELDLGHNHLADMEVLQVLAALPALQTLTLLHNPLAAAASSSSRQHNTPLLQHYRRTLICRCRTLTALDQRPVFPQERRYAEAWAAGRQGHDSPRCSPQAVEPAPLQSSPTAAALLPASTSSPTRLPSYPADPPSPHQVKCWGRAHPQAAPTQLPQQQPPPSWHPPPTSLAVGQQLGRAAAAAGAAAAAAAGAAAGGSRECRSGPNTTEPGQQPADLPPASGPAGPPRPSCPGTHHMLDAPLYSALAPHSPSPTPACCPHPGRWVPDILGKEGPPADPGGGPCPSSAAARLQGSGPLCPPHPPAALAVCLGGGRAGAGAGAVGAAAVGAAAGAGASETGAGAGASGTGAGAVQCCEAAAGALAVGQGGWGAAGGQPGASSALLWAAEAADPPGLQATAGGSAGALGSLEAPGSGCGAWGGPGSGAVQARGPGKPVVASGSGSSGSAAGGQAVTAVVRGLCPALLHPLLEVVARGGGARQLLSCALVSRGWCRAAAPLLRHQRLMQAQAAMAQAELQMPLGNRAAPSLPLPCRTALAALSPAPLPLLQLLHALALLWAKSLRPAACQAGGPDLGGGKVEGTEGGEAGVREEGGEGPGSVQAREGGEGGLTEPTERQHLDFQKQHGDPLLLLQHGQQQAGCQASRKGCGHGSGSEGQCTVVGDEDGDEDGMDLSSATWRAAAWHDMMPMLQDAGFPQQLALALPLSAGEVVRLRGRTGSADDLEHFVPQLRVADVTCCCLEAAPLCQWLLDIEAYYHAVQGLAAAHDWRWPAAQRGDGQPCERMGIRWCELWQVS